MRKGDREIYKKCKMDCFNCPFPDCKMSEAAPDLSGIEYEEKKTRAIWTPEKDKLIVDMRRQGKTYNEIAAALNTSYGCCRERFIKLTKEQK